VPGSGARIESSSHSRRMVMIPRWARDVGAPSGRPRPALLPCPRRGSYAAVWFPAVTACKGRSYSAASTRSTPAYHRQKMALSFRRSLLGDHETAGGEVFQDIYFAADPGHFDSIHAAVRSKSKVQSRAPVALVAAAVLHLVDLGIVMHFVPQVTLPGGYCFSCLSCQP
jgi:hypothetical protein